MGNEIVDHSDVQSGLLQLHLHFWLNTLRPRQKGRHFADDIFKWIFLNENVWISIKISLKFVPQGPINNIPALVQIMAWCRPGDKPLSGPMMVRLPTHICVARPQWVNTWLQCIGKRQLKTRRGKFKFGDLVRLMLEILRGNYNCNPTDWRWCRKKNRIGFVIRIDTMLPLFCRNNRIMAKLVTNQADKNMIHCKPRVVMTKVASSITVTS